MERALVEISVITSDAAAEAVGAIMADLRSGGLVEDRPSSSGVRLRCYLPPSRTLPVTLKALRTRVRSLARFGLDPSPARVVSRRIAARRWATAWRAWVRPIEIGRLVVKPTWVRATPGPRRAVIEIDPGMAFGTGMHPTTRLCLRALVRYLPRPPAVRHFTAIDVGTGSGILAIAAARLGVFRIWARDTDPLAVAVARANVRTNGVTRIVRVSNGAGLGRAPARVDLILANIIAETIITLLPEVRERLAPGGIFVGSGIVEDRLSDVQEAAASAGLEQLDVLAAGDWRAVVLSASTVPRRP